MASKNQQNPPALRTISDFKNKLSGGGARPNLFEVVLSFPADLGIGESVLTESRFLVKTAALPASNVAPIEVPFRGRVLKIAGDRTFEPWTVTIMNDSKFSLRNAFETWVEKIQAANENITQVTGLGDEQDATGYFADMFVHQLSRDASKGDKANILRSYKFTDVFPSNVSAIDLDFGSNDAVEEFTVELQIQYWQAIPNGITA